MEKNRIWTCEKKHQCAISLLKNLQLIAGMHGVYFVMNSVDRRKWRVRHPSVWKLSQKEKTRGSFSILQMDGIQTDQQMILKPTCVGK